MIKFSHGKSYAEVLGKLRKEVNLDDTGSRVCSSRTTQNVDVLILLSKGSNKEDFMTWQS